MRALVTLEGTLSAGTGRRTTLTLPDGECLLVPLRAEGVAVEELPEPRTWTDGDVVQNSEGLWTLTRIRGQWVSSLQHVTPSLAGYWTDDKVSRHLDESPGWGRLVVLRYQAGDQ